MDISLLIPWLAGVIGVPVTNYIKDKLGWSGKLAVGLTVGVSVILAAVALLFTGGLTGENLLANVTIVFSTATIIYKLL